MTFNPHNHYYSQVPNTIKIPVCDLELGMYVADLDRPWLETPFLTQGFSIQTHDEINQLNKLCRHVYIDSTKRELSFVQHVKLGPKAPVQYRNKVSTKQEISRAASIYREAQNIAKSMLEDIRLGGSIDTEQAKSTVNHCVDSVLRNPDALLWMSKMRNAMEYTTEHCLNVCILAIAFGRKLGLEEDQLHNLGFAGLLHDVGKMRVPEDILNKPDRLSNKEFTRMKTHTVHGRNLLMKNNNMFDGAIDVAYCHHERLDGGGYPRKLSADKISQFSRMIAIVDAYDAMTAERCYAPAMTSTDALKEIYRCRGSHFDDQLALNFIKTVGLYPPGSIVELADGCIAMVVSVNPQNRHLPEVCVLLDQDKKPASTELVKLEKVNSGGLSSEKLIKKVHCDGSFGIRYADFREKGFQFAY